MKILFCVGPRCNAEGRADALRVKARLALERAFTEEIANGRLTWDTRDCLRLCTRDPVIRLEPSGDAFSNPSIDELVSAVTAAIRS